MPRAPLDLVRRALRDTAADRQLFVDREDELTLVTTTVRHGGNVLLLGERGVGKSSLLRFLRPRLETAQSVALVDGRVASTAAEFLSLLRDRIARALHATPAHISAPDADWLAPHGPPGAPQLLLDELERLRHVLGDREPMGVLVDELPSAAVARVVFGRLRDELWNLPLTWCVAADEADRASYVAPPADAFWSRVVPLEPFADGDARELVSRRLARSGRHLPTHVLDELALRAGANPRRLLALAHEVVVDGAAPEDVLRRHDDRAMKVRALSEPARRLLAELESGGPGGPSDEPLLKRLGWSRSRAAQVFKELEKAQLVVASKRPMPAGRPRRVYEVAA